MRLTVLLPLANIMLFAFVISDQTATCARAGTDQRTLAATEQTAHDRAARSRAADDLGLRVVPRIMVMLLAFGLMVGLLAERMQRGQNHGQQQRETGIVEQIDLLHRSPFVRTVRASYRALSYVAHGVRRVSACPFASF